jgi:methylmalonyl-CoA mutase N-terminal domain/subunit
MAAVLGGAQSLHTNSLDEAYALPSEHAVTLALRTQQILAYETGVANTPDPLGGSYFVESLTLQMEAAAHDYIDRIDQMGGMIAAIEAGFPQQEIAAASYRYQREVEQGERVIVGANRFESEAQNIDLLEIDESAAEHQEKKLAALRARRHNAAVQRSLDALSRAAETTENTMPFILDAVRAYATVGEICDALRQVLGTYSETARL